MPRYLLAIGLTCVVVLRSGAQSPKNATAIVPVSVEQKFVVEHPDATARWQKEGRNYKASFINPVNNLGYITVYDSTGTIIRKERELEPGEVPAVIGEFLNHHRRRGQGFVVWSVTDSAGRRSFYAPAPEGTVVFDDNGRPVGNASAPADSGSKAIRGPRR